MDVYTATLTQLMTETYRSIIKIEYKSLQCVHNGNLTAGEMRMLEAVGKYENGGRTVSEIARDLEITLPSATVAINKLYQKGYLDKRRSPADNRLVFVTLTRLGKKMYSAQRRFRSQMVRGIIKGFSEEEKKILVHAVNNLNHFFQDKLNEYNLRIKENI